MQYEIYEPYNKTKLNLSFCDKKIDVYIPVALSEKTKNIYNEINKIGYDLFDIDSPFYNDICIPFNSPEGTDVLLSDRVNSYFYNDDTSCQSNCKFSEFLKESQYLKCECDIISSVINISSVASFSGKSIYQIFYNVLKYSNYKVLKCTKLALNRKKLLSNIGSISSTAYFLFYFLFLNIYAIKGKKQLKLDFSKNIPKSMQNKNSIKNRVNKHKKNKNKKILKNIKTNKKRNKKIKHYNPPKKNISIYNKQKSGLKIRKKQEKTKFLDNRSSISSMRKKSFFNSYSKRDLNKNINKFDINIKKYGHSQIIEYDNYELNNLEYAIAKKFDKRNCCKIYWSFLKREHLVIFTFITRDDHNITFVKYSRFFFLLCTDMAMNVFFFADETMHKMFLDYGKFNFIQQIPQVIYSTIVSQIIEIFICFLSLTDKYFYEIKECNGITKAFLMKIMTCIKVKITIFYVFTFLMFIFYWYFITCFCAVYPNTQIAFIKDFLSSFALGIFLPFILYIFPSIFRIISLKSKSNIEYVYKFSNIIPFF